ncbi:hypothetical protein Rsub_00928 [Raphidocelis subcapitata]|uniref:Peptidase A1 domain-containing protein n=1 Tax=Raphidocelis subcapitata TaxID=307507 RepID=A0A2V0NLD1_9CHLO|nr:hypothetical protein Rsub_00928 [Raphidocelis subcapitata]|eukprot:GBF88216.1 hypothetical protein Rsub_00928 [Raphidocelis subcapitata]
MPPTGGGCRGGGSAAAPARQPSPQQQQKQQRRRGPPRRVTSRRLPLLLAVAAAAVAAAAALPAAAAASDEWLPLTRVSGVRTGVHGLSAAARGGGGGGGAASAPRRLREQSFVLDGSTKVGYYTAPMSLGSPPQTFHLILDSGSSLTVVPCKQCDCGFHQSKPFDPAASSTSRAIGCSDDACSLPRRSCNVSESKSQCSFYNLYAEGSSSGGVVLTDKLLLPRPGGRAPEVLEGFKFGCAKFQTGQLYTQEADGVAGLGFGPAALPAQLAAARKGGDGAPGAFSLCLGADGGAMALGKAARPPGAPALQYVSLLPSDRGYYVMPLQGWRVGDKSLDVTADTFGPPASQRRVGERDASVILDSGATFSYLASPAFTALLREVKESVKPLERGQRGGGGGGSGRRLLSLASLSPRRLLGAAKQPARGRVTVEHTADPLSSDAECWRIGGEGVGDIESEYDLRGVFPDLELAFAGGAKLKLSPERYMFIAARQKKEGGDLVACLGVFDGDDETVIGAVMMRDAVFEFDHAGGNRVGFADADCAALARANAAASVVETRQLTPNGAGR